MTYNSFDNINALAMAKQTNDAYSFDRYGEKVWFDICRFMLKEGLNKEQVRAILRSKHMRWAADCGNPTYQQFRKYYYNRAANGGKRNWVHYFFS